MIAIFTYCLSLLLTKAQKFSRLLAMCIISPILLCPVQFRVLRSHGICFLPKPLRPSMRPSTIKCTSSYFSFLIFHCLICFSGLLSEFILIRTSILDMRRSFRKGIEKFCEILARYVELAITDCVKKLADTCSRRGGAVRVKDT